MGNTFTVRSDEDLIALAPVVLGFQPKQSLVMMTMDQFHARVDLPHTDEEIAQVVQAMLTPVHVHQVASVAFLVFNVDDDTLALQSALLDGFSHINVIAALEVGDGSFRRFGSGEWRSFDVATHPLTLEAQYAGAAPIHATREDLGASIAPCGDVWTAPVRLAVNELSQCGVEHVITSLTTDGAADAVVLWTQALRGSEPDTQLSAEIALVLAFAAWLNGHGALAWMALELADGGCRLHWLLTFALSEAVSPRQWPGDVLQAAQDRG